MSLKLTENGKIINSHFLNNLDIATAKEKLSTIGQKYW